MPGETLFVTQTAVIMQEFLKGLACAAILLATEGTVESAWAQPSEALKTAVPAFLYLGQNNLQYVAVGMLDAATYTITYQSKTIWSGIFSVLLLGRVLKLQKWCGLLLLALGVATVQFSGLGNTSLGSAVGKVEDDNTQRFTGAAVLLFAAALSSMAGVYFEKILKGVKVGLWTRNLQLAGYSCAVAVVPLAFSGDMQAILANGFFYGYTRATWYVRRPGRRRAAAAPRLRAPRRAPQRLADPPSLSLAAVLRACIFMNAGGGLLVGTVIKYADAVTKDFAIGASIVLSSVASTQLFGFEITPLFFCGSSLVVYAVFLYAERATCGGLFKPLSAA